MFAQPLSPVSATSISIAPGGLEDGGKPAEIGDSFAALLGMQVVAAAGEAGAPVKATPPGLAKGGKALPLAAETGLPGVAKAEQDALPPENPPLPGDAPMAIVLIPNMAVTIAVPPPIVAEARAPTEPATAQRSLSAPPATIPSPHGLKPDVAKAEAPVVETGPVEPPVPIKDEPRHIPALPGQAAARAIQVQAARLDNVVDRVAGNPILPEPAAAQARLALVARGSDSRSGHAVAPGIAAIPPTEPSLDPIPTPVIQRPVKDVLADETQPLAAPTAMTSKGEPSPSADSPAATFAPAASQPGRADFATVIDRLLEARDAAVTRPVAMTMRHDDFGSVSLHFRTGDDGLSVTMASPDPDFARAVNAATATATAPAASSSQSDTSRQSGDPAPSRQGGGMADDHAAQSRGGSRSTGRSDANGRREPSRPHDNDQRQHSRSGIFA